MIPHLRSVLVILATLPAWSFAHGSPAPTDLVEADRERIAAMVNAEPEALLATLADDLRYAHSNGVVDTRDALLTKLRDGELDYHAISYEELNIKTPGPDLGLLSGTARTEVTAQGNLLSLRLGFLAVYQRIDGRWKMIAWQSNKLPDLIPQP